MLMFSRTSKRSRSVGDLTDHQRKAGSARTERKAESSRANIAKGRDVRAEKRVLRKLYVEALEDVLEMFPDGIECGNVAFTQSACDTVNRAYALRAKIGGKR